MCQPVQNQVDHVLICKGVNDMLAVAGTPYNVVGTQHAQALRHCGDAFPFHLSQIAHASAGLCKASNNTHPRRVAHCAKDACTTLNLCVGGRQGRPLPCFVLSGAGFGMRYFCHNPNISTLA